MRTDISITDGVMQTAVAAASVPTLREALNAYILLPAVQKHKGYQQEQQRALEIGERPLGRMRLTEIESSTLIKYRDVRAAELAKKNAELNAKRAAKGKPPVPFTGGANTIRLELALVSSMFTWLIARNAHQLKMNPCVRGTRPKPPKGRKRRLTPEEEARLLSCAGDKFRPQGGGRVRNPAFRVALLFGMDTAMRLSEILGLTWDQVNLEIGLANLEDGKTKNDEGREVPLSPRVIEALSELPRKPGTRIFNYTEDGFRCVWYDTLEEAEIDNASLHFHDLRHEATSKLFEDSDISTMEASKVTGHKSLAMLDRYTHLKGGAIREKIYGSTKKVPAEDDNLDHLAGRLQTLIALKEKGLISEADFAAKKTQLLDEL